MEQITAILNSPVAVALCMGLALLWFAARDRKRDEEERLLKGDQAEREKRREAESRAREDKCAEDKRLLQERHVAYLEGRGDEMTKALVRTTQALDNHASQLERNTRATENQTETFKKHFPYTNT